MSRKTLSTLLGVLSSILPWLLYVFFPGLALAQAPSSTNPNRSSSESTAGSVTIISQIRANSTVPKWCYGSEPAFVFAQGRSLVRADASGNVIERLDLSDSISLRTLSCSRDGRTISLLTGFDKRLVVIDTNTREKSVYSFVDANLAGIRYGSFMSPDGNTLTLPGQPVLLSGSDLLRDKRVIRVDSGDVFWTKDLVFTREGASRRFRVRRLSDLGDVETIELRHGDMFDGIYQCSDTLYVAYTLEKMDQRFLEPIPDRQQSQKSGVKFDRVGDVEQGENACTVSFEYETKDKLHEVKSVMVLQDRGSWTKDLSGFNFRRFSFAASKDHKLLLTWQPATPSGSHDTAGIVVLRIGE